MGEIIYLNKRTSMQSIFTFALLTIGLGLIVSNYVFYGIIFTLIGLFVLSSRGLEFKTENNAYRKFLKIFGVHIGKWIDYPEVKFIAVIKTRVLDDDYPQSRTYSDIINVRLFYNQNQYITVYQDGNKIECFRIAEKLKSILNVEIFDTLLNNESHRMDLVNDSIKYNFKLSDSEKRIDETEVITKAIRRLILLGGKSEIPLTQNELNIFEIKYQIKLPADLVSFLSLNNGLQALNELVDFWSLNEYKTLETVFQFGNKYNYTESNESMHGKIWKLDEEGNPNEWLIEDFSFQYLFADYNFNGTFWSINLNEKDKNYQRILMISSHTNDYRISAKNFTEFLETYLKGEIEDLL